MKASDQELLDFAKRDRDASRRRVATLDHEVVDVSKPAQARDEVLVARSMNNPLSGSNVQESIGVVRTTPLGGAFESVIEPYGIEHARTLSGVTR